MIDADAKRVLEAVLFSNTEVMTLKQIGSVLGDLPADKITHLIDLLNDEYERTNRTFRIIPVAKGYQMRTLPMFKTWIQKAEPLKPPKLSQPALETLAIVAYRQPVTRADVENLRGVDASHGLRSLLEKKLVRILGKDKAPGRPILYGTTKDFLSLFNLNDLRDLPTLEEFDLTPAIEEVVAVPAQEVG